MTANIQRADLFSSRGFRWRSLRTRIVLFAALVCLILLALVGGLVGVLRSTQSASLRNAESRLHTIALSLRQLYYADPKFTVPLMRLGEPEPRPPLPPPPAPDLGRPLSRPSLPLPPPQDRADVGWLLNQLMTNVLLSEPGVEGGFFRLDNGRLGGYAYPTHEAPGPPKEMPVRERPTIEWLARRAATSGVEQSQRFEGQHDAVLFDAIPLHATNAKGSPVIGAAWFMERLPGAEAEQHRQLLLGASGFSLMALLTCAAVYVILSEVRGGLRSVSTRLAAVVSGAEVPLSKRATLAEFDSVLSGIDHMAQELQEKIRSERTFQAQLAHQDRLAAVGQFAAGIAHEFRNPLATIRLRTQMSQQAGDVLAGSNAKVVLVEIDRLNAMIGKLLHFARPIKTHEGLLDLAAVASDRAQRWNEEYGPGSVRLHDSAQPAIISGDRDEFRQVFDNLIENALQATDTTTQTPFAEIALDRSGPDAVVTILDRGPGFSEEALLRALEPFYTVKEQGTGLGLAIANEIVRAHGGFITVNNREGGGAMVRFQLSAHFPHPSPNGADNA